MISILVENSFCLVKAVSFSSLYSFSVSNVNKDVVNPYTANVTQLPPAETVKEQPKLVAPSENKSTEERTVTLVKYDENEGSFNLKVNYIISALA